MSSPRPPLLDGKDCRIIAATTLVYLAVALFDLGSLKAPRTWWTPARAGESFVVRFDAPRDIARISYYEALGQGRDPYGDYRLDYTDGAGVEHELGLIHKTHVFVWNSLAGQPAPMAAIRVTAKQGGAALGEIAFFEKDARLPVSGLRLTEVNADPGDAGTPGALFDEQDAVPARSTSRNSMVFDEVLFARSAYEHLHRIEAYETGHPPLGKSIIALGILVFGMNPFGWRIMGVLFGAAMLPAMYAFGKRLLGDRWSATASMLLMAADFMHFTMSRIGTVDVFVVCFLILSYYFMGDYYLTPPHERGYRASLKPLLLSGLFFGLGAATKWNAVYGAPGLLLLLVMAMRREHRKFQRLRAARSQPPWLPDYVPRYLWGTLRWCVVFFLAVPAVIYILAYVPFLLLPGPGHTLADVIRFQGFMYAFHRDLVETHRYQSMWWEWPLILKPFCFVTQPNVQTGRTSAIVAMGNPLTWWLGLPAALAAAAIALRKRHAGIAILFAAMLSLYLPWLAVERVTFIYHFFPILPFLLLAEVYVLKTISGSFGWGRKAAWGFIAAAVALFIAFYPVLSGIEVSPEYIHRLEWLKGWRF